MPSDRAFAPALSSFFRCPAVYFKSLEADILFKDIHIRKLCLIHPDCRESRHCDHLLLPAKNRCLTVTELPADFDLPVIFRSRSPHSDGWIFKCKMLPVHISLPVIQPSSRQEIITGAKKAPGIIVKCLPPAAVINRGPGYHRPAVI